MTHQLIEPPLVVGIGGTTRAESTTELLARAVLAECERLGAKTRMFGGAELLSLPHYVSESATRTVEQVAFVSAIRSASAFVFATPGYHGSVSGLVKNAIDLIDDTRTDPRVYLDDCPVGLIVSAAGWQATGITMSAMRDIVHALRGWPTPLGIAINSIMQKPFDENREMTDEQLQGATAAQARQLMSLLDRTHGQGESTEFPNYAKPRQVSA